MKTLQEIKDTYAKENGCEDWDDLSEKNNYADDYELHWTSVCIRAQKIALEKAVENAKIEMDLQTDWYFVNKESITNEENLIR